MSPSEERGIGESVEFNLIPTMKTEAFDCWRLSSRAWIPAAAGRRGVGLSVAAHSNERPLFSRAGPSMADSPGGEGTRRSGRARRAASIGGEDFVDPIEVDRRSRAASSKQGQSRVAGCAAHQRAGEARGRRREQAR